MATITIRNLPENVVRRLKDQARQSNRSMEQHVRLILEAQTAERSSVLRQIEDSWKEQTRPTTAEEVLQWMERSLP